MIKGINNVVYPVTDLDRAKALYSTLLGIEPYADSPYYVGFRVNGQDIGLDPNGHKAGATVYYRVDDIQQSLQALVDAGAQVEKEVSDVGGGTLTAILRDTDGNIIGLVQ